MFSNASEVINKWLLMIPLLLLLRPAISTTLESFQRSKRYILPYLWPDFSLGSRYSLKRRILGHALCVSTLFSIICHFEFEIFHFFYYINKFYLREQILNDNDKLIDFDCINSLLIVLSNDKYAINFIILRPKEI